MFQKINKILAIPAIRFIRLYQYTLSPDKGLPSLRLKGRVCMHTPHCSKYSVQVLKRYGFRPGIGYALDRVLHCTGGMKKIYDPDHYRIVFFSGAPIGVPFLQELTQDKRFEIVGVVTQGDKPVGRGMEMAENIIKQEAKGLVSSSSDNKISKIILIHGKTSGPDRSRFPRFAQETKGYPFPVYIPAMPSADAPVFEERIKVIEELKPDEHTILIGHSRGGSAVLRRLEQYATSRVKKVILIAANDGQGKYKEKTQDANGFITEEGYNFEKIKKHCDDFVVFHSKDDQRVDYRAGVENAEGLDATLHTFENKNHFAKNLTETGFPELIQEIEKSQNSEGNTHDFIKTPSRLHPEKSEEGRQFTERLKEKNPDFLVVIAYGKIIPQAILDIPKIAPINVHGSLLPKYRGASPIQSCLLRDDKETGITIMKMDAEMDTGNMIDKLGFKIGFDRTSKNIIERFQTYGPKFLNDTLWKYGKKMLGEVKQDDSKATYCSKIEKESGLIDPRKDSLHDIYCKYRAYAQWPKIYFMVGDKRIIIEEIKLYENIYTKEKDIPLLYQNNTLNESVEHLSIKPEGKKAMDRKEFANGYLR